MLRAALRDLQWRRKRFGIAMAGVALVFAMGVVMTGLTASFSAEVSRTLDAIGATAWAVSAESSGPFTSFNPVPADTGGADATPMMVLRQTLDEGDDVADIVVMGVTVGGLGAPEATEGASLSGPGQAVADRSLSGGDVGDLLTIGGRELQVVGTVSGQRLFAGLPVVYVPIEDARAIATAGAPFATAFLYDAMPAEAPAGLKLMTNGDVKDDVLRPLDGALASIRLVRLLLWIVAATVIGSVLYLQAIERTRDFAVFKATGTSTAAIGAGLAVQAVVLSIAAAALAAVLALVLAPLFPLHVEIPTSALVLLPVVTVAVSLVASSIALRRAVSVEPALAFGG